jgi:Cys-tRNA(Pro)/Cys-tRNA(Cys) deacylase
MVKTNAMRMLDKAKIAYETVEYQCDEDDLIGLHAAEQIKIITPPQCFKTLVARGERKGLLVFCVPVTGELDLKAAAYCARDKKVELIHVKELFDLTGYIRGGCSPIGMKKKYPTFIDATAQNFDRVGISGGIRGVQMILNPAELVKFTGAELCALTKKPEIG